MRYAAMNLCRNPEHPHCTVWVTPGASACAHGHPQPALAQTAPEARRGAALAAPPGTAGEHAPRTPRPHLHISGFDPRAAGGRQALKLELRGMPAECPGQLALRLKCALHLYSPAQHMLTRGAGGQWCPAFVEFSSRGLEHGQHRIEVELHAGAGKVRRTWICSLVVLVPRADASLADIQQAFLSSHKNVRIFADDSSIARVNAHTASGSIDIDVAARNAGIARLDLDASQPGRIDLGMPTIAWDEDLVEIAPNPAVQAHPYPATAACLVNPQPSQGMPRHMRLFAGDEWVLGRFDAATPAEQVLLAHPARTSEADALTRRISARHAVIRMAPGGFEIEDVSRYGLLLDGEWPGKNRPVPLREGMCIEFTASVRGIVTLRVDAVRANAVVLARADAAAQEESFWLVVPGRELAPGAGDLPLVYHDAGGFWLREPGAGAGTALAPSGLSGRAALAARFGFAGGPYPETWSVRARVPDRRRANAGLTLPAR
jgi:hypothetical protein